MPVKDNGDCWQERDSLFVTYSGEKGKLSLFHSLDRPAFGPTGLTSGKKERPVKLRQRNANAGRENTDN
jgi:hypothetical protein